MVATEEFFSLRVDQYFETFLNKVREWIIRNPGVVVVVPEASYPEYFRDLRRLSTPDDKPGFSFELIMLDRAGEYVCDREQVHLVLRTRLSQDDLYDSRDCLTDAYRSEVISRIDELIQQVDKELRFRFERAAA